MIGQTLSHYRILEQIGAGGMGQVYLAEDLQLERKVALKFLPPDFTRDPEFKARFEHEAKATAALNHPNIVTVYELAEHEGQLFIAMEHVDGRSLEELIERGDLTLGRSVEIACQICEGLSKAHQAGIVHRDIKPSNILIDADGRAKILDFGLAKSKKASTLTKTGTTLGTLRYESPEQATGQPVDARSDLFSVGAVLYEMITGRSPFAGEMEEAVRYAVVHETPEPLARYKSGVPDDVQRIVSKLLEKDAERRAQSAADVVADLRRLSSGSPDRSRTGFLRLAVVTAGLVIVIGAIASLFWPTRLEHPGMPTRKMVAVLPFENLGAPEDEYFADGITDEIITQLAKLSGLGVISRTSSLQYKGSTKSLREIGSELGVDYVLEGTIRWDKSGAESRVRINPQLIQADNDLHLWAERYDAVLTNIFDVQAAIAAQVAEALDLALLATERSALAETAPVNPQAYDYYLRGRQHYSVGHVDRDLDDYRQAEAMHLRAIEIEPTFAQSYAELGVVYTQMYWDFLDRSEGRLAAAREAVERSLELAPEATESHFAVGWYAYHGERDYERARQEFEWVLERQPNNSIVMASLAYVKRRQGGFTEALALLRQAVALDPREPFLHYDVGLTLFAVRRYREADPWLAQAIHLAPRYRWAYTLRALSAILQSGRSQDARVHLQAALEQLPRWPQLTHFEILCDQLDEQYEHALTLLSGPGSAHWDDEADTAQYYLLKADLHRLMDHADLAAACSDSARANLDANVSAQPDESLFHAELGVALAGLGMKDEALREGYKAIELVPVSEDAFRGAARVRRLATTCRVLGEYELALDQLEYLLSIPSIMSIPWLQHAPEWAPIWDHPRFLALVKQYGSQDGR
jgi:non-specific serine/threonine protein kinase